MAVGNRAPGTVDPPTRFLGYGKPRGPGPGAGRPHRRPRRRLQGRDLRSCWGWPLRTFLGTFSTLDLGGALTVLEIRAGPRGPAGFSNLDSPPRRKRAETSGPRKPSERTAPAARCRKRGSPAGTRSDGPKFRGLSRGNLSADPCRDGPGTDRTDRTLPLRSHRGPLAPPPFFPRRPTERENARPEPGDFRNDSGGAAARNANSLPN